MSPIGHLVTASAMAWCYLDLNDIGVLDAGASLSQAFLDANDGVFYSHHAIALVALGIVLGARGPDRLEIPTFNWYRRTRQSLIPHRTLTHWPPFWVFLTWLAWTGSEHPLDYVGAAWSSTFLGFCAGSWLHLAMDIMTPMGIPLLLPFGKRTSLNIYKTATLGEGACVAVFLAVLVFFAKTS